MGRRDNRRKRNKKRSVRLPRPTPAHRLDELGDLPLLRLMSTRPLRADERHCHNLTVDDEGRARARPHRTNSDASYYGFARFDGRYTRRMGDREELCSGVVLKSGDDEIPLQGHRGEVTGMGFSMDSTALITTCDAGEVLVHDLTRIPSQQVSHGSVLAPSPFRVAPTVRQNTLIARHQLPDDVYGIAPALSSSNGVAATLLRKRKSRTNRWTVRLWLPPGGAYVDLAGRDHDPGCLALSPDGGTLAIGYRSGLVELWCVGRLFGKQATRRRVKLADYGTSITDVTFCWNGRILAVLTGKPEIAVWRQTT